MYNQELKAITESVLNSGTTEGHILAAERLTGFYKKAITSSLSKDNEILVKGGFALSSFDAAACMEDRIRTTLFIQGVYRAIQKLQDRLPGKSIGILYAGCGPYAPLILPLLTLFETKDVKAILLDINASSIDSVKGLIPLLGLEQYQLEFAHADATTYIKPEDFTIDLLVSETMHYGLTREPQVAILKNLVPQTPDHSIVIPEKIHIDFGYSFFAKEPFFKKDTNNIESLTSIEPYPFRVHVDRLFTISKELFYNKKDDSTSFESIFYKLPEDYSNHPDVCVFTEVVIFEELKLTLAESYLTSPYCIVSLVNLNDYSEIQLVYDYSEISLWKYNLHRKSSI